MINNEILIGIIGVITTFASGFVSWFFTRKKYNTEVDSNLIANMKESLEFYKQLSDDNKERLEEVLKRNDMLEQQIEQLRTQVFQLMSTICSDLSCQLRKRDLNLFNEHEPKTRKKVEKS